LEQLGIQPVSDLPGVGENYRDHPFIHFSYKASLPEDETLDCVLRDPAHMPKLMAEKNTVLGTNGLEIFGRWRPSTSEVEQMRNPRIAKLWAEEFVPHPSKPFMLTGSFAGYLGPPSDVQPGQYFTIGNYIPYPRSQGSVHITGKQVDAPLDISTGFFEGAGDIDLDLQVWAYKRTREVARRLDCYLGEVTVGHPQFATSSKAALVSLDSGSAREAALRGGPLKDIEYTSEDDEAIKACIRERIATAWHYLGSAPMRPREEGGVVDKDLHVYGVSRLMVAGELFLVFFSFLCPSQYFIFLSSELLSSSRWRLLVLCYRQPSHGS
jgi:choline dehydrogenase-like flavoprotein